MSLVTITGAGYTRAMDALHAICPAKLNLTLAVGPRRSDGYHPLESLVALLEFGDELSLRATADGRLTLTCDDPSIPTDQRNLVIRAAEQLRATTVGWPGAHCELCKRIPAGAGLGGGSSNAAAALRLLNTLWQVGRSEEELAAMGAEIGSDVPLFLHGPVSVMRGRGEAIEPLTTALPPWALLVLPGLHCATADVYRAFDVLSPPPPRPAPAAIVTGAAATLMPRLFNDLEPAALHVCPPLGELMTRLRDVVGPDIRMTGSGSTLFHLYDDEPAATAAAERVREAGVRAVVTRLRPSAAPECAARTDR